MGLLDDRKKSQYLQMAEEKLQGLLNLPQQAQRFLTSPTAFLGLLGQNPLPKESGFAAGATGLPPTEMSVLDPNQAPYMQGYGQGEPVGYAGMALPLAAPAAVATGKALAPKAGLLAENYMQRMGGLMPLEAYHGTPHTIADKFDVKKGGSGQGTQNFGYGTYFAENPTVAEGYMGRIVIQEPKLERFTFNGPDYTISNGEYLKNNKPISKGEYEKAFEGISDLFNNQNKGNLYKVDIPDEMIPKMLNWYEDVPEGLRKRISEKAMEQFGSGVSPSTGERLYKEIAFSFKQAGSKNPQADASMWLVEQGVPGIKYENFQIKKGQGANTNNYVVFQPEKVKILERNKKKQGLLD